MDTMPLDSWIELWVVSTLPLVFYLGVVRHAYQLYHKLPMQRDVHWRWSFLWIQLAIVGTTIIRVRELTRLWSAGRAQAWTSVDPEILVASWCIAVGLLVHTYLLDKHPVWQQDGPVQLREKGP